MVSRRSSEEGDGYMMPWMIAGVAPPSTTLERTALWPWLALISAMAARIRQEQNRQGPVSGAPTPRVLLQRDMQRSQSGGAAGASGVGAALRQHVAAAVWAALGATRGDGRGYCVRRTSNGHGACSLVSSLMPSWPRCGVEGWSLRCLLLAPRSSASSRPPLALLSHPLGSGSALALRCVGQRRSSLQNCGFRAGTWQRMQAVGQAQRLAGNRVSALFLQLTGHRAHRPCLTRLSDVASE
jgi:hypothetical protein